MGTGVSPSLWSPKTGDAEMLLNIDGQKVCVRSEFYGQAERAISSGKLNTLLHLHIRPINVVVFDGPC
jgi:hypothetical protein